MDEEIKELTDKELAKAFTGNSYKMYMREISHFPSLSEEEQKRLGRLIQNGDESARIELTNRTLRWVVNVAWHYRSRLKHMQILDVIQEGNLGLMRATEDYDPEKGAFTTYATWWIRQAITRSIADKNDEIRKPVHVTESITKYLKLVENYTKSDKPLPSDEEMCDILDISKDTLKNIREALKQNPVSLNQTIGDDGKTELEDFVSNENNDYDNILNQMVNDDLLLVLKEVLSPLLYFVIYHRILSDEQKTLEEVADYFNITRERVRQIEAKALKKLKPYMIENSIPFARTLNKIRQREGYKFKFLKKKPLSPISIIKYMFLKDDLNDLERKLYELILLGKYNFKDKDYAEVLGITLQEVKQVIANLKTKINKKFSDTRSFKHFKDQMIKTYGTGIFDIDIDKKEKIKDYRALEEKYSSLNLETILSYFKDVGYELTTDEEKLLDRYFGVCDKKAAKSAEIEKEVNIVKFGFKNRSNNVPLNKLYKEYQRIKADFSEEQQLYLETYFFGKKDRKLFREAYPNSTLYYNYQKLINRLERSYYHIFEYFENNFTKENWLKVKAKYWERFSDDRIEMMDLYFGVKGKAHTRKELAKIFNLDKLKLNAILEPTIMFAIRLYSGMGSKIDIDKKLYIPFVINPCYEFVPETRTILKQFLIEEKTYKEISKTTGLTVTRISNIITGAIKRIDFYRFGIITATNISEEELKDFFNFYGEKITDIEKEVIRLKYFEFKDNQDIVTLKKISISELNRIVARFIHLFYSYQIRNVEITENEIAEEIELHPSESVLRESEKEFASLRYGIKSKYNNSCLKISREEIKKRMGMSEIAFNNMDKTIKYSLKGRKIGIKKPENLFIPRSELDTLLDDIHLPINEKEREIICHLFELKGFEYMTFEELSLKYNEYKGNVKERYKIAITSIYKYLNKEIEGVINYDVDVLPIIKYFGISDRMKIEDFFKNGLTYDEMAKKYGVTKAQVAGTMNRIRTNMYDIMNNPYAKKFDFDYYLEAINNPLLPYDGDLNLAIQVFNLSFGMTGEERLSSPEVIKRLNLDFDQSTINRINASLMLSVCKLRDGIVKKKTFTYEEIYTYYTNNCDNMLSNRKDYYLKYFNAFEKSKRINGKKAEVSFIIITDLILATYPDAFRLNTATKEDVMEILTKYGKELNKRIRTSLMGVFGIREREFMSGKDLNHVFRLLDTLDTRRREYGFQTKSLTVNN